MVQKDIFEEHFCDNWKDVIDKMTEGLMLVDPNGKILYVNQALEKLLQFKREELEGNLCDILECDRCFGHRQGEEGKYCGLFEKGDVRDLHCTFRRKDGQRINVLKNATVLKDRHGNVVGGVENLTDLSAIVAKDQVITNLKKHLQREDGFMGIIGKSQQMQQVFELCKSAAQSDAPVIVYGESGTGKELVAAAIHRLSRRQHNPFIKVNCAALNENLLESELFGHIKGSFTGADRTRMGRFEAANNGDIFLDEIGDLPLATQTKLLRVLQEQEIERVGDHQPISIDVRIIAATNRDLQALMRKERFREDLYYRIGVIPITLPPLRQRKEDIPLLVEAFIDRARAKTGKDIEAVSKAAMDKLINYHWPGNIRELINVIEYTFVICPGGKIGPEHLPQHLSGLAMSPIPGVTEGEGEEVVDRRQQLLQVLEQCGGNKSEAARRLGMSRVTLWKKLKKYKIAVEKSIH